MSPMDIFNILLRHRSVQILILISLYLLAAPFLPLDVHRGLYTISLLIKDLLLLILPVTVGFFIAYAIASFEKRAPLFIISLFLFEALSNASSVLYAYGCGHLATHFLPAMEPHTFSDTFTSLWRLSLAKPIWWSANKGSFAGIVLGLLATCHVRIIRSVITVGKELSEKVLTRFFSRLIPLFILGFVARMYKTELLHQMLTHYADLLVWLILFLVIYIAFLIFLGSDGTWKSFAKQGKHLLPAAGMAFSSGCSLSTMPWTIEGAAKNMETPDLAKAIIPATTNIQQIGDCIANAFLCFLIYSHFNGHVPPLSIWLPFSCVFVLARFATAAVLGGALFIMIPLYEAYLGFNSEMIAMIVAFNVILDPLVTCANVVANGALCRVFEKGWSVRLRRSISPTSKPNT